MRIQQPANSNGSAPRDLDAPRPDDLPDLAPDDLIASLRIRDWLLSDEVREKKHSELLDALAARLNAIGVPVDRMTTAIDALHSEYSGIGRIWTKEQGSSFRLFPHGTQSDEVYARSPFAHVHRTGEWLLLDPDTTPDSAFGVVPELKAAGSHAYLCIPMDFANGTEAGLTFSSYTTGAFDGRAMAVLRSVAPTVAAAMEIRALGQRLDNVLRIYVGDEPHRAILSGAIRRGQVSRIKSAILFADMRSYTQITSTLDPESAVELLNTFFDCLVPPIESEGGEVLKYMGDGLLAIFRDRGDDTGQSAQAALSAAVSGLVHLEDANKEGLFPVRVTAGIALHHGEAAYGNVGSGNRLDFTVIGPDVNLASRIATMNKILGEPLLMSKAFAEHLWGDPELTGHHKLDGFSDPVPIYRLRFSEAHGGAPGEPTLDLAASG